MSGKRLGRVVVPRKLCLAERGVHFFVADVVHQNGWAAFSAFQLGDQMVQALRNI